ncbi:MAG: hypothetical protein M3460_20980 [Actinomycetota bacterium]|nr:hypothetical protein [Actinomycetota bacterium]
MSQPRRNEPRFYRYPMRRVAAIIDDSASLEVTLKDLETAGIDVSAVNVLSGEEGARLLDRTGVAHGLRGRLLRLAQWTASEYDALAAHEKALINGRHVLYVPVNGSDQRQRVVDIIRDHGGYWIIHFKRWVIERIPPYRPSEG